MLEEDKAKQVKEELRQTADNEGEAIKRLKDLVELLRKECPWDREQTHESLRVCMIEEAYESCEAIDRKDYSNLKEELGDVLLQVVFHASLAQEKQEFELTDVINSVCDKMILRHPHVFQQESLKTIDNVLEKWENIKQRQRGEMAVSEQLEDVPKALPALMRSEMLQKKAAGFGFDWDDVSGALAKAEEERNELLEAIKADDPEAMHEEVGDWLMSVVNISRFLKVNPEEALEASNRKFIDRIKTMEEIAEADGRKLKGMTLEELDDLWNKAKDIIS